jgi:hypothetical protein
MIENLLCYGDNPDALRRHVKVETSNATYNVIFAEQSGERAAAQIRSARGHLAVEPGSGDAV